jgi:predicted signal transduction protein with EAL and GGDEF domain
VAEGVERTDELSCLLDLGVHYVQGFLLARPALPPPVAHWPDVVVRRGAAGGADPLHRGVPTARAPVPLSRSRIV